MRFPHTIIAIHMRVKETDFGGEKVASHPAQCSTEVISLPFLPS